MHATPLLHAYTLVRSWMLRSKPAGCGASLLASSRLALALALRPLRLAARLAAAQCCTYSWVRRRYGAVHCFLICVKGAYPKRIPMNG